MAERKKPLLLRAVIVVVALFLGLSLNMFQFRNPFRGLTAPGPAPEAAPAPAAGIGAKPEPTSPDAPGGGETLQGQAPDAPKQDRALTGGHGQGGSSSEAGPASSKTQAAPASPSPQGTDNAVKEGPGPDQPARESGKAPEARPAAQEAGLAKGAEGIGKAGETASAPVAVVIEPAEADLSLPKVTTDKERAKAAGIGRARPANVAEQAATGPEAGQDKAAGGITDEAPARAASSSGAEQARAGTGPAEAGKEMPLTGIGKPDDGKGQPPTGADKDADGKGKPRAEIGKKGNGKEHNRTESPEAKAAQAQPAGGVSPNSPVNAQARAQVASAQPGNGQAEGGASVPGAGKVLEIKTQERGGEFVLTIVTDCPIERVTSFHARNPARLAVDLWGGWQPSGPLVRPVEGETMEKIRLGAHPDKLRLVIDYNDKDMGSFSEPVVEKQPRGVVVRLPKAAAAR